MKNELNEGYTLLEKIAKYKINITDEHYYILLKFNNALIDILERIGNNITQDKDAKKIKINYNKEDLLTYEEMLNMTTLISAFSSLTGR